MSGAYRTVYFLPDPALSWRIPVAVLVRQRDKVRLGVARHLPDDACIGGRERRALLRIGLDVLSTTADLDRLPAGLGPHFLAEPSRALTLNLEDPLEWLVGNVLPLPPQGAVRPSRGERRATIGFRFFEHRNLADRVRHRFQPARHLRHLPMDGGIRQLYPVSHWVPGGRRLLLMEPLLPARRDLEREVQEVTNLFLAYRAALVPELEKRDVSAELLIYLMPGGTGETRASARSTVADAVDHFVDTSSEAQALAFAAEIGELSRTAPLELFASA